MTNENLQQSILQTESSDTKMFYQIDGKYYRSFEHAKEKVMYDIARHISDEDVKKFVSDELDKLESIDSLKESIIKQFDRSRVTIYPLFRNEILNIEIDDSVYRYLFSINSFVFED